jgi:hypothetical protein
MEKKMEERRLGAGQELEQREREKEGILSWMNRVVMG